MKRLVQWCQLPEVTPLPVMDRVFEEALEAWRDMGCRVERLTEWSQVEDGGFLFLDDAGGRYTEEAHQVHYARLAALCPTTVFIGWYWMADEVPFQRFLRTGEHYLFRSATTLEKQRYMLRPDFLPFLLRASDPPHRIGQPRPPQERDYCFMGGGYKRDWLPCDSMGWTGFYHQVIDRNYLDYETRRRVYLTSRYALAFQSDENIRTGHLSQRIFEGLAYGCIVFCENPLATAVTHGAVIHVTSKEDLWAKMAEWYVDEEKRRVQQEKGYEWTRRYGTNRTAMALLWRGIQARWGVTFDTCGTVSIRLMGGLGNQLFQMATAYAHADRHGARLSVDATCTPSRPFHAELLGGWLPSLATADEPDVLVWRERAATVMDVIPEPPRTQRLDGYFQSGRYFLSPFHRETIARRTRSLSIEHSVTHAYKDLLRLRDRVIVLHARRGDYLQNAAFHGPLPMSYYEDAVRHFAVTDPIYLLVSDDPTFWDNAPFGGHVVKDTDVRTFVLMTQFRRFVISNSTFAWWAAWMSTQREPTEVIAPAQWFGPAGPSDWEAIYEPGWRRSAPTPPS